MQELTTVAVTAKDAVAVPASADPANAAMAANATETVFKVRTTIFDCIWCLPQLTGRCRECLQLPCQFPFAEENCFILMGYNFRSAGLNVIIRTRCPVAEGPRDIL